MRYQFSTGQTVVIDFTDAGVVASVEGTEQTATGGSLLAVLSELLDVDEAGAAELLEEAMRRAGGTGRRRDIEFRRET